MMTEFLGELSPNFHQSKHATYFYRW